MHAFSVAPFGLTVTVAGDDERILGVLDRYVLPWLPRQQAQAADLVLTVTSRLEEGCYRLCRGRKVLASSERMPGLFRLLQWALDDAIIRHLSGRVAVHAGVVVWCGTAILLPGKSGVGKTTLVHELVRQGAEYSSDEYALIGADGLVHPWPRPLMMRDVGGHQHPVLATDLGGRVREAPAPPGLILFLRRKHDAGFALRPMTRSDVLLRMLENTPHVLAEKPEIIPPLTSACAAAPCYEGFRGDAAEAASRILELVASR